MASSSLEERLTKADVLDLLDDRRFDLVDGKLIELRISWRDSIASAAIACELHDFVRARRLGFVAGADNVLDIFDDPYHFRLANASFTRTERVPGGRPGDGDQEVSPDLVVEVVPADQDDRLLQDKIEAFLDAGVPLVWVVNPGMEFVDVIRRGRPRQRLGPEDLLDGEDVLPGFSYPVADIFDI